MDTQNHDSRRTLFVVTVPGMNNWARDVEANLVETSSPTKMTETVASQSTNGSLKRNLDNSDEQNMNCGQFKKMNIGEKDKNEKTILSNSYLLNSPIPTRPSKVCMVKVSQSNNLNKLEFIKKYSLSALQRFR